MDHQTHNLNGSAPEPASEAILRGVGDLSHDIITVVELQYKLAVEDFRSAMSKVRETLVLFVFAAVLCLAGVPILLVGTAELITHYSSLERGWAYCLIALIALVLGLAGASVALRRILAALSVFSRSRQELAENLTWLKSLWNKRYSQRKGSRTTTVR
jgi:energy-converting hydrogenase Eha subunit H